MQYARRPCSECPWRRDVPVGKFPPERYRALASTSYDLGGVIFACHQSKEGSEFACAGFLLRGAAHNLATRLARQAFQVDDGGLPLFDCFRQMAIANGVHRSDPALRNCRDDTAMDFPKELK